MIDDRYLGDGVYASYDGYHIVLDLRAQDETTRIALEPAVFHQLTRFREDLVRALSAKIQKDKEEKVEEEVR